MDRRVTSPTWGPPPPCKQALRRTPSSGPDSMVRLGDVLSNIFPTFVLSILILSDLSLQLFGDVCFECNKAIVGDGKRPIIKI